MNGLVKGIFSIYDVKARTYSSPMLFVHKGEAIRVFSDIVKDPKSTVSKHPEDYKLYYLGVFDVHSGQFSAKENPEFMNNATDFLESEMADLKV